MVTILNRKQLLLDISQVECGRVKQLLQMENIEFYIKISKSQDYYTNRSIMQAQRKLRMAQQGGRMDSMYIYRIYVRRKDYDRARKLAYGN